MNITYVIPARIPSREANSIHVMKMCSAFANARADGREAEDNSVTLLVPGFADTEAGVENVFEYYGVPENFKIKRIDIAFRWLKKYRNPRFAYSAARFIKKNGLENVYSRDVITCYFLAALYKIPFCLEIHELFIPKSVKDRALRKIIKSGCCKKFIVITEAMKQHYISNYNLDEDKITVAPDGADIPPESTDLPQLAAESSGKYNVGFTGHLYKGRGMEILGDIARGCPFAFFHIIGGTDEDVAYWKDKYSDIENICFYGFVPPVRTADYGRCMDALIAPYQSYMLAGSGIKTGKCMSPLKIFEYMALKKPIISSDLPVICEVLTDEVNAIVCHEDDVDEWIRAIEKLYKDNECAERITEYAYQELVEKYTWNKRAENLLRIINS